MLLFFLSLNFVSIYIYADIIEFIFMNSYSRI